MRLAPAEFDALEVIATSTMRTPSGLARDWVLERLATLGSAEPSREESPAAPPREKDEREVLRQRYRPDDVIVLLVGESPPAGGAFFYQADSHLYSATREAFERALGTMPIGDGFLERFKEMGFWLYDMVDEPVNRKPGRPRRGAVANGVRRLEALIGHLEPDYVVGIKTSIGAPVRQAAQLAAFPANRVLILPFPLYQWREEFVSELSKFLNPRLRVSPEVFTRPPANRGTLHEAMRMILSRDGGAPMPARQLANRIAAEGLYQRRDGARADHQQLLARARKYPHLFAVSRQGISLRRVGDGTN